MKTKKVTVLYIHARKRKKATLWNLC